MSLSNVQSFYQRLAQDEEFRIQLQGVKTKEECSQLVQQAGYDFTQEEFQSYTYELLESNLNKGELEDLNEKELEAVFGGAIEYYNLKLWFRVMPAYGVIDPFERLSS